ncbi:MAG: NAD-dependent epimerase/dehydratase family protein [Holophaga sp.]|jgi:UDP-glucose 4-epimerase
MRVLVTGGAGFIGSHLGGRLMAEGHRVAILDNLRGGVRDNLPSGAEFLELDLRDPGLPAELARLRPEAIVHCAAQIDVRLSCRDPLFDAGENILGTLGLLEAALGQGLRHFVFASSGGAIYGEAEAPQGEDHPERPSNPYGVAKLAVDKYLHAYAVQRGLSGCSLRFANAYGPRQGAKGEAGVVAVFCRRLAQGLRPVVNGDGLQTRDFVYVDDLVDAAVRALERRATGILNVGTARETSILDLARRLCALAGVDPAGIRHQDAIPGEQRRSVLDPGRARAALGWEPRTTLDQGLAATWAWFQGHP